MADRHAPRAITALQQLLGDVRLAVLAAVAVLGIGTPAAATQAGVVLVALIVVWVSRRPPPRLVLDARAGWLLTAADLLTAILVLAMTGVDSLALVYTAMTAASIALRFGWGGALVAVTSIVTVHLSALIPLLGRPDGRAAAVVVLVRLLLIAVGAAATVRLRDLLLAHEALATEVRQLRERAIRDAERSLLARDMHDSLAKTLHGTLLLARRLGRLLATEQNPLAPAAESVATALLDAQAEARALLAGLRAEPVDDLRRRVVELTGQWQLATGVPVRVELPEAEPELDDQARTELAAALAELLENVHRHAGATVVDVRLGCAGAAVVLEVTDDGRGMPPLDLEAMSSSGHFGLVGVHERMSRVGGRVAAQPGNGPGTTIRLAVPPGPRPAAGRILIDLTTGVLPGAVRTAS